MVVYKCLALLAISTAFVAADEDVFKVGTPSYFGSGCAKDTVSVASSADGVAVLFSDYHVETKREHFSEQRTCDVTVPVTVQPGASVGVVRADYKGKYSIPVKFGWSAKFEAEYSFAGQQGPKSKQSYFTSRVPIKDFVVTNELPAEDIIWSQCGVSTSLRVASTLTATGVDEDAVVQIKVNSADATSGFYYELISRKC